MEHDCVRSEEIGGIKATLQYFKEAEERREARERRQEEREGRMIITMSEIAEQGAVLKAHGETLLRHEKSLGEAFNRLRKLESPSFPPAGVTRFLNTKAGRIILVFLIGAGLFLMVKNPEAFGKILKVVFSI